MPTLFLASDSTCQTYTFDEYPQMGWGQLLFKFFKEKDEVKIFGNREGMLSNVVTYEMPSFSIENHAIMARSSRSFINEGRLDNLLARAKEGDVLAIQFAHNDAYKEREERYVPVSQYGDYLKKYKDACDEKRMRIIFVTPVSMRVFDENGRCQIAFNEYREAMLEAAKKLNVPCIDLSLESTRLFNEIGSDGLRDVFLWLYKGEYPYGNFKDGSKDNAHFQSYGAELVASLVAKLIIKIEGFEEYNDLKKAITDDFSVKKPERRFPEGFTWEDDYVDVSKNIISRE